MISELQTIIKPVTKLTEDEIAYAVETAKADGHGTLGITHVVERDKQPIGHISICGVPLVLVWLHTKQSKIRDTLRVLDFFENRIRDGGGTSVLVPCSRSSPYYNTMEGLGYIKGDDLTFFTKGL